MSLSFFVHIPIYLYKTFSILLYFPSENTVTYAMNKRKQMSDDLTGSTLPPSKKHLTRHMYTNEQHRFVWYHRDILKMPAKETHKKFYNHYSTNVAVSVDSLNQLAGRLRRIQSPEVVLAKNTEAWALPAGSASAKVSQRVR